MEREVWKRIFSELSDKKLVELICVINETLGTKSRIGIKGVSDLNKIKAEQIHLFRSRIEAEISKSQNVNKAKVFLRKLSEKHFDNFEYVVALSEKDTDTLWEELLDSNTVKMNDMIMYLMIQTDPIQINKGMQLYGRVIEEEKNSLTGIELDKSDSPQSEQEGMMLSEEEWKNMLEENEGLKEKNDKLEIENKKLQEQNKDVIKTNKELKKSFDHTVSLKNEVHKELQKLERDIQVRKTEIASRDHKIKDLQNELKKSQEAAIKFEIEKAQSIRKINELIEEKNTIENEIEKLKAEYSKNRRSVTIIDRNMPDGLENIDSIVINLITPNLLEQTIQTGILEQSDEIWFIKFRLSTMKQNLLNERYGTKVIGFSTYNELKEHSNIRY
ncbi:hypothetical protein [Paenibacillus prosopidis]|uniref:Uncharacterized protein n=1 Tax=Paenibacillus prosopidis TaxID=630520 RepID=A0A368VJG6_9BACL|nr:hypothetical protein [Paenibacillus prosopidis]RCW41675.1 hypothetical protein DFP97_122111 [Paenibacillus prosopidis]